MLLLFLSFFALQLFLTTPLVTGKEHAENSEYFSFKTASESTDPKMLPFLIMKDQEVPGEASLFNTLRNNIIILLYAPKRRISRRVDSGAFKPAKLAKA